MTGGTAISDAHTAGPGRPRDPELEDRVFDAVLNIYAEEGWGGLTFGAVARHAGVGKSSLYLRWNDKATMLVDALRMRPPAFNTIDTGSVREDLVQLAETGLRYLTDNAGLVTIRLFVDAQFHPELTTSLLTNLFTDPAGEAGAVVRRAIEAGKLQHSMPVGVFLHALFGGVLNQALSNPNRDPRIDQGLLEYHVDLLLHGALSAEGKASHDASAETGHTHT